MAPPMYPLSTWQRVPAFPSHIHRLWPLFFFFMIMIVFSPLLASSSPAKISYADHCELTVPSSTPTSILFDDSAYSINVNYGFFRGGDKLFAPGPYPSYSAYPPPEPFQHGNFYFYTYNHFSTRTPGIIKLDASINFMAQIAARNGRKEVNFQLSGFWSKDTGNLCMIGIQSYPKGTNNIPFVVFELYRHQNSDISTSVVSGIFDSLDRSDSPNYFDRISVLAYAPDNYRYTKIPQAVDSCSHDNVPKESLGVARCAACNDLIRMLSPGLFELEYGRGCDEGNCGPLGFSVIFMYLNQIQCTENGKVHMHIGFSNESNSGYHSLDPDTSLLSEGFWDSDENRLCLVACRIMKDLSVGDCTIGLTLWFPAALSITSRSTVVGRMWSTKDESAPDYFSKIYFRGSESNMAFLPGIRYEYTKTDNARSQCKSNNGLYLYVTDERYPDGNFANLRFDLSVRNVKGDIMTGYATLFSIGETFYGNLYKPSSAALVLDTTLEGMTNVSYKITYSFLDPMSEMTTFTDISAEGVYDSRTRALCLVGCRYPCSSHSSLKLKSDCAVDCEILISIQLSHLKSRYEGGLYGSIWSTRETWDPLYFDPLELSARNAYERRDTYDRRATQSIWRMDTGTIMILMYLVLSCFFVRKQMVYAKKHPGVLPSMSMLMLLDLTLSQLVPLIMKLEGLFSFYGRRISDDVTLQSSSDWVEVKEVTMRAAIVSAFILQLRLLQWAVNARSLDKDGKALMAADKHAAKFSLLLYYSGHIASLFRTLSCYLTQSGTPLCLAFLDGQKPYAGLVRDSFLLPQILLNIARNSADEALSPLFYIGITVARAIPDVYGAYRTGYFVPCISSSISFASACEIFPGIVLSQEVIFVVFVFLQQRFGGRFFLPKRFRKIHRS